MPEAQVGRLVVVGAARPPNPRRGLLKLGGTPWASCRPRERRRRIRRLPGGAMTAHQAPDMAQAPLRAYKFDRLQNQGQDDEKSPAQSHP